MYLFIKLFYLWIYNNDSFKYLKKFIFIIGLILFYFVSKIKYRKYYKYSNKVLLIWIIILILVLTFLHFVGNNLAAVAAVLFLLNIEKLILGIGIIGNGSSLGLV